MVEFVKKWFKEVISMIQKDKLSIQQVKNLKDSFLSKLIKYKIMDLNDKEFKIEVIKVALEELERIKKSNDDKGISISERIYSLCYLLKFDDANKYWVLRSMLKEYGKSRKVFYNEKGEKTPKSYQFYWLPWNYEARVNFLNRLLIKLQK